MFSLSLRNVDLLLAERGILVSSETARRRCKKFGASFADRLRRRRPRPLLALVLEQITIRIVASIDYRVDWLIQVTHQVRQKTSERLRSHLSSQRMRDVLASCHFVASQRLIISA